MSGFPSPSFSLFNGRGLKSKEFSILCHWKLSISTPKKKVKFFSNGDGCAASCCRTFLVDECDSLASPLNNFVRKEIYFQKLQKKHHIKPNLSMFGAPLFPPNLPSLPRCFWTEEITMATGPNQPTNDATVPRVHGRRRWRFKDVGPTLVTWWRRELQRGIPVGWRALNVGPQAGDFHTGGRWLVQKSLGPNHRPWRYPLKTLLKNESFMRYSVTPPRGCKCM